ncbi:MraY family glycosyltransferase [Denitrobaculum tricleocarpae]|uniref:Glycosyltransferase family 4 protein n=1 Tax=Denitrobaculum tricleocarpae TaxID=2591009 RepID=A0A545TR93_9PROT|nr:glycosyltransferase family 4 protein [Denitrobaculum tricleocarpae]TQV79747.1 glycosyltransferase family 4 protein [Denitrobaculum tricleocarpae]
MTLTELIFAAGLGAVATWAMTFLVLKLLVRHGIFDTPNERSSHAQPKPRGGGLAVLAILLPSWGLISLFHGAAPPGFLAVLAATLILAAISWLDDVKNQPVVLRLIVQFAVVIAGIAFTASDSGGFLVFQGVLPDWLDHLFKALAWVWFINLFNFMDGADGITGIETLTVGLGLGLLYMLTQDGFGAAAYPIMLAACTLGFLVWNWAPSKIFLGDIGSVTLGYLIGWLLLVCAAQGHWAAALLLPLYYLCDATITLVRRALRGEKVWRGHREHFYQKAMLRGAGHAWVSRNLLLHNIALVFLALVSVSFLPWFALAAGTFVVAALLFRFANHPMTQQGTSSATE